MYFSSLDRVLCGLPVAVFDLKNKMTYIIIKVKKDCLWKQRIHKNYDKRRLGLFIYTGLEPGFFFFFMMYIPPILKAHMPSS